MGSRLAQDGAGARSTASHGAADPERPQRGAAMSTCVDLKPAQPSAAFSSAAAHKTRGQGGISSKRLHMSACPLSCGINEGWLLSLTEVVRSERSLRVDLPPPRAACAAMQDVPIEVLGLLLQRRPRHPPALSQPDAHALACTCKALRAAVMPAITAARVLLTWGEGSEDSGDESMEEAPAQITAGAVAALHERFPKGAMLRTLRVSGNAEASFCDMLRQAAERLHGLQALHCEIVLYGAAALEAVAHTCPNVRSLSLRLWPGHARQQAPTSRGAELAPLSGLTGLEELSIRGLWHASSLLDAPTLTQLRCWLPASCGQLASELRQLLELLPSLARLQRLCLILPPIADRDLPAALEQINAHHHFLTPCALDFELSALQPGYGHCHCNYSLSARAVVTLCQANLVRLALPDATISQGELELLAVMPSLEELHVRTMKPTCRISGPTPSGGGPAAAAACAWRRLLFDRLPSPQQLLRLPLAGLEALDARHFRWVLPKATKPEHVAAAAAEVAAAAALLARCLPPEPSFQRMAMQWEWKKYGRWHEGNLVRLAAPVLSALRPIRRYFSRLLLEGWELGSGEMRALVEAAPGLATLELVHCSLKGRAWRQLQSLKRLTVLDIAFSFDIQAIDLCAYVSTVQTSAGGLTIRVRDDDDPMMCGPPDWSPRWDGETNRSLFRAVAMQRWAAGLAPVRLVEVGLAKIWDGELIGTDSEEEEEEEEEKLPTLMYSCKEEDDEMGDEERAFMAASMGYCRRYSRFSP